MSLRRILALAALSASCLAVDLPLQRPARAEGAVDCWMNSSKQTCTISPWKTNGMEIRFSGSAIFRFVPAGPPTTDKRPMRDEQGRLWLMSGHHSFELVEQGGDGNKISVSSERGAVSNSTDHQAHSKVKLSGNGKPTVTLYAQPSFGAAVAGMGVSGETLDKLACTSSGQGTWCRVGYPGQSGRVLWVPKESLIFIGDGE